MRYTIHLRSPLLLARDGFSLPFSCRGLCLLMCIKQHLTLVALMLDLDLHFDLSLSTSLCCFVSVYLPLCLAFWHAHFH